MQSMTTVHQLPGDLSSTGISMMPQQPGGSQVVAGHLEPVRTLPSIDDPLQMLHSMQSHYFDRS